MDKDILAAVSLLKERGLTFAAVKDGDELFLSHDRGIGPAFEFYSLGAAAGDASVADTIVGKGAAVLFAAASCRAVHGCVMTVEAVKLLADAGIAVSYDEITEKIMNRQGTGSCPVETLAAAGGDAGQIIRDIETFLMKEKG